MNKIIDAGLDRFFGVGNDDAIGSKGSWVDVLSQVPRVLLEDESVVGVPKSIRSLLLQHHRETRDTSRTFSSGCNDAFSVFGFLAFLLALLDLIMELNGGMMMGGGGGGGGRGWGRRKRAVSQQPEVRQAMLASYSMFRGFLNALDADNPACSALFMCEAAVEAARRGQTGYTVSKAAR